MKITLKELRSLIRESVRRALRENTELDAERENTELDADALIKELETAQTDRDKEDARKAINTAIKRLEGKAKEYRKSPDKKMQLEAASLEVTIDKLKRSLLSKKEQDALRNQDYVNDLKLFRGEFAGDGGYGGRYQDDPSR